MANKQKHFKSSHKLNFEATPWHSIVPLPFDVDDTFRFRVGTCEGLFSIERKCLCIVAVINNIPGNGHFNDVLEWFENSCKREKCNLKIVEIWNRRLLTHLVTKRGFQKIDNQNVIKYFK